MSYRGSLNGRLQIFGTKPGVLGNAGEHPWPNFFAIVKGEHRIRPFFPRKHFVRACLPLHHPSNSHQGGQTRRAFIDGHSLIDGAERA